MTRTKPLTWLATAAVLPLAALAVAVRRQHQQRQQRNRCAPTPLRAANTSNPSTPSPAVVRVSKNRALGKILVDSKGRTLYLFTKDSGNKSACLGMCATPWPPLLANGTPRTGAGAKASLLGAASRSGGAHRSPTTGTRSTRSSRTRAAATRPARACRRSAGAGSRCLPRVCASRVAGRRQRWPSPSRDRPPRSHSRAAAPAAPAAPPAPPAAKPKPKNTIPQNGGGDGDADNSGGPDDGDGGV